MNAVLLGKPQQQRMAVAMHRTLPHILAFVHNRGQDELGITTRVALELQCTVCGQTDVLELRAESANAAQVDRFNKSFKAKHAACWLRQGRDRKVERV